MKKQFIKLSLLLILSTFLKIGFAQSISFNLLQQPCDVDGELEFTVSGVSIPCTITIWDASYNTVDQYTLNDIKDTIFNYTGQFYNVQAYDGTISAYGNFSSTPFTFDVSITNNPCPTPSVGNVTNIVGGQGPYTINWLECETSSIVAQGPTANLPMGLYDIEIFDANGCVSYNSYSDTACLRVGYSGITPTIITTNANCTDGTAEVVTVSGGTSPYTYEWSNGQLTNRITNLSRGTYIVDVTDANGCTQTSGAYVNQSISFTVNTVTGDASCEEADGSVIAFGSGGMNPYTYQYSNGANTQSVSGLESGNYFVDVTDNNGCISTGYFNIGETTPITVTHTTTPSLCDSSTGAITLNITGGAAPYVVTWNTYPVTTGETITNLAEGRYSFTVTDINNCRRTGTVYVPYAAPIRANPTKTDTRCDSISGYINLHASGGTGPLSFDWNNGDTTEIIDSLDVGNYTCIISDTAGCILQKNIYIRKYSTLKAGLYIQEASCMYTSDGVVTVVPINGIPPYSYRWTGTQDTTATVTNISPGNHWVRVRDANGCWVVKHFYMPYNKSNDSCYCTISGTVYYDQNINCIQESNEEGVENVRINCRGFGSVFTDENGYYEFKVPSGNYTISEQILAFYPPSACQNNLNVRTYTASSGCRDTINFANEINPIHDMKILNTRNIPPVVGEPFNLYTVFSNKGTIDESNIQFKFKHDGQLQFNGPSSLTYSSTSNPNLFEVNTGFPMMEAGEDMTVINRFMTPVNIPINTRVEIKDTVAYDAPITNWLNDYSPWNNIRHNDYIVVGSYDPNEKEVYPRGEGEEGFIEKDVEYLNYTVHFQNTGTWPASLVVIKDTLDENLDWNTLTPGWSDHRYVASIDSNGVVEFRFENINLPDSGRSLLGSMGQVSYEIKLKENLPELTQIKNRAGIYFDYNPPIITNTTLNTIKADVDSSDVGFSELNDGIVKIYPNPTDKKLNISLGEFKNGRVIIYNAVGELLISQQIENNGSTDVRSLIEGLYLVQIETGEIIETKKLIILR